MRQTAPIASPARSFAWNGADRLTQRGTDTFAYDPLGRMTSSTVGAAPVTRTYAYDGDGLLRSRTQNAATTSFLWDPSVVPAPLLAAGSDRVVHGLGPLYLVRANGTTLTLVRDALGSVRQEAADSGLPARAFRYAAYGEIAQATPSGATPTLLGFTGELRDGSGLIYLRARWYDAGTGRFTTMDSYSGSLVDPSTLNGFSYAGGRPTNLTDPLGLDPDGDSVGQFARGLTSAAGGLVLRQAPTLIFVPVAVGPQILFATKGKQPRPPEAGEDERRGGEYQPPPKELPGFPEAKPAKGKTPRGEGKVRRRWTDSDGRIYEWDYQHGTVEVYDRRGRHLGEFDPDSGLQTGGRIPSRRVER